MPALFLSGPDRAIATAMLAIAAELGGWETVAWRSRPAWSPPG
jgi:hypothetical protein